ncbi:MAG: phycobilisome protein [Nodosilinea sp.]
MLANIQTLVQETDGRYASDQELQFFQTYLGTANLRLRAYQKIQAAETQIIAQVLARMKTQNPDILQVGGQDLTAKWQRDTVRVLRYSAMAILTDDAGLHKEKMLNWFQTIMRAFGAQRSCQLTYVAMQEVVAQYLEAEELALLWPILELNRATLGQGG